MTKLKKETAVGKTEDLGCLGPHKIKIVAITPTTINSREYLSLELIDHTTIVLSETDLEKQRTFKK